MVPYRFDYFIPTEFHYGDKDFTYQKFIQIILPGEAAARKLIGDEGVKPGGEAGAKAGKRFGLKIGRETGARVGLEMGETLGRLAGSKAGAEEAFKVFKIGISKERVLALKRVFAEVGE